MFSSTLAATESQSPVVQESWTMVSTRSMKTLGMVCTMPFAMMHKITAGRSTG